MTAPDTQRLVAELAEARAENTRLVTEVASWRAAAMEGWVESDPPPEQDELRTLLNIGARMIVVPLRALKRLAGRSPRLRRVLFGSVSRAQVLRRR